MILAEKKHLGIYFLISHNFATLNFRAMAGSLIVVITVIIVGEKEQQF